MMQNKMG